MRVKCLAQEDNTVSSARVQTRLAHSGDEPIDNEVTAPPIVHERNQYFLIMDSMVPLI